MTSSATISGGAGTTTRNSSSGHPSGRLCRRRVARRVLPGRRVPDRGAAAGARTTVERRERLCGQCWRPTLGQGRRPRETRSEIPFVDFARGDGRRHRGRPGRGWTPMLARPEDTPGPTRYRGLWGLYSPGIRCGARTPRRARCTTATARRGRPGTIRSAAPAWTSVPPQAGRAGCSSRSRWAPFTTGRSGSTSSVPQRAEQLQRLGIHLQSLEGSPHLAARHESLGESVLELSGEVKALRRERSENVAVLEWLAAAPGAAARRRAGRSARPHPPRGAPLALRAAALRPGPRSSGRRPA